MLSLEAESSSRSAGADYRADVEGGLRYRQGGNLRFASCETGGGAEEAAILATLATVPAGAGDGVGTLLRRL
jgi:hypothetical protein